MKIRSIAFVATVLLLLNASVGADSKGAEFEKVAKACGELNVAGQKQCLAIVARHEYAPPHQMRALTFAEKTAIDAIMETDKRAVIVFMPDGSVEVGEAYPDDRSVDIPCVSMAACK